MNKVHNQIKKALNNLGIKKAIAGYTTYDGTPVALLRWNGKEEYVSLNNFADPVRSDWLSVFADDNLKN